MADLRFQVVREQDPARVGCDLLIVPLHEGEQAGELLRRLDRAIGGGLLRRARDRGFRGREGQGLLHPAETGGRVRAVYLAGLGPRDRAGTEAWRRAGAAGADAGASEGARRLGAFAEGAPTDRLVALAEGAALARYRFDRYRKPDTERRPQPEELRLASLDRALEAELERLRAILEAVFAARDLVNEPPSVKSASFLARRARELCAASGVQVEVMGRRKIRSLGLAGLLAVNRGSSEEPRFLRMRYRPRRPPRLRVALVGKGITFDSGGLSLKPPASMETMKQDMAGAATVIATMAAVGRLRPPVEVTGYVPSTDNLPSGSAQKPGDVIRYRNGKTVEVLNTDAEGRLILADALILACEQKHDVVIDVATLTGACRIALGPRVAGAMGNDEALIQRLVEIGREVGEPIWPLPLVEDYREELKSTVADLKNVGGGAGGAITAGLFLREFVDGAKWVHLDIAGPAFADKDWAYCPRGGTGFGVRTLVRYLTSL